MIVCSCNAIREKALRQAVREGAERAHQAYAHLGCKVQCGQCLSFARELIADEQKKCENSATFSCQNDRDADILPFPQPMKRA